MQTDHHKEHPVYFPKTAEKCTHVYVKRGKVSPLGPPMHGPYKIEERLKDSSLKLFMGHYADGKPRYEVHHWHNCQPYELPEGEEAASRPALGRRPKVTGDES